MTFTEDKLVDIARCLLKYQLLVTVGILLILLVFLCYQLSLFLEKETAATGQCRFFSESQSEETIEEPVILKSRINGLAVEEGADNLYPVAVMIDNHTDARPNYGLSRAKIVYEVLVEGGATRFLAFYTPQDGIKIEKIGPVRSARLYFVFIAKEMEAMLAHAGGSPAALAEIDTLGLPDLEEIAWWGSDYFWRVHSRSAPYNLFTADDKLFQALTDWRLDEVTPDYRGWLFGEDPAEVGMERRASEIKINFSSREDYNPSYKYNQESGLFMRYEGAEAHIDPLNGRQIEVANLVIQYLEKEKVIDKEGRLDLNIFGSGKALMFRDGLAVPGRWTRNNITLRTIFWDEAGNEFAFKPGNIWLALVPGERLVEYQENPVD